MWTTEMLSSVVNISPGNSIPAKKKSELFTGVKGMPYVATKDVSFDGIINYDNGICIPQDYLNNFRISPKYATLICAEGGSAGRKIAFSHNECCYVNKLFSLEPTNKIIPKFLYYYSISAEFQLQFNAALHGLIGGVSLTKMKKFSISYPSIPEQERIVAKLDAAFTEVDKAVENTNTKEFEINKLQASILCASLSTNAIKSELTPITELCNAIYAGGDAPAKENISKVKTKKYKTPIYSNGVKDSGLYGYTTSEPRTFQPAITISARGTIGHIELRNKPFLPIVRLIVLEPKIEKIDLTFLKYALLSMKIFSSGSSIPQLTVPMLKKMNLSLPPLAEQKQIVKKLNTAYREFENACILIEKSRQSYKSLKSAILAQELQSSQGEAA